MPLQPGDSDTALASPVLLLARGPALQINTAIKLTMPVVTLLAGLIPNQCRTVLFNFGLFSSGTTHIFFLLPAPFTFLQFRPAPLTF